MTNDRESAAPQKPHRSIAEGLLAEADKNPELRAHLIERWARAPRWTCLEGIALAWTLDPKKVKGTAELRSRWERALPEEARHYLELARRSSNLDMYHDRVKPESFIEWAHGVGLAFHQDWHNAADSTTFGVFRTKEPMPDADRRREELVLYWARSPYWSPGEGAALAYDLDPANVIENASSGYGQTLHLPSDARQLFRLADRAAEVGTLDAKPTPLAFMTWARSIGFEFHPVWWAAVREESDLATVPVEPSACESANSELGTKEQESLLKLVAAMAIAYYGWDPAKLRSNVAATIASDLESAGVPMHPDTIRKWIRRGADLLPRELR